MSLLDKYTYTFSLCVSKKIDVYTYIYTYVLLLLLSHFSHVRLFVNPWTVACQAPLSMGFSRQGYWSGLPFPSPGIYIYTHTHTYRYLSTYVPNIYIHLHLFVCYCFSPVPNLEEVDWFTLNFVGPGKEEN